MKREDKREKALLVRLTAKEHEELLTKAAGSKVSAAEYVRMLLRNEKPPDREIITAMDKIAYEINKIGVNVNQIAYKLNGLGIVNQSELVIIRKTLERLLEEVIDGYIKAAAHQGESNRQ